MQAWDDDLDDIAALTHTDRALLQSDGTDWTKVTEADIAVPNRQTVKSFQAGSAASYLSIPDDPSVDVGTGDFSVFWWAKINSNIATDEFVIRKVSGSDGFSVYHSSTGDIANYVNGESFNNLGTSYADDKWHFFALTFDRDTAISYYVDGVLVTTNAISSATDLDTSTDLEIMGKGDSAITTSNVANYIGLTKDLLTPAEVVFLAQDPTYALRLDNLAACVEVPSRNVFVDRSPNAAAVSLSGSLLYEGYEQSKSTTPVSSTTYTVLLTDSAVLVDDDTAAGDVTISLPALASVPDGYKVDVKKLGTTGNVTIDPSGAELIDGNSTEVITSKNQTFRLIAGAAQWFQLSPHSITGWATYSDSTYTSGSALTSNNAKTQITIDGLGSGSNSTYLPEGVTQLWDSTTNKIIADQVGDAYDIRLDFKADPSTASDYAEFILDIGDGAPDIPIVTRTVTFAKTGASSISIGFPIFSLATFIANGGKLYFDTSGSGDNIDIYDITLFIKRDHSPL